MIAFINGNPALVALALLAVGVAAAILCAALLSRRAERRQARVLGRLRHDSEQQSEAVLRLGESLNAALRQIEALSGAMENRQDRMRRTLDERMELMNQANERRLGEMRELVTGKLDGRLNESFKVINGQLANVHKGLGEMRELSLGVTDLRRMLVGVKTRGVWGEVQLRALLEQLFAPGQLVENAAIPALSQNRVEFALRLPTAGEEGGGHRGRRRRGRPALRRPAGAGRAGAGEAHPRQVRPPAPDHRLRGDVPAHGEPLRRGRPPGRPD